MLDETTIKLSTLSVEIWGKVYYMEKNAIMGKVYLRDWDIIMDNSSEPYDGRMSVLTSFTLNATQSKYDQKKEKIP